MNKVSKEEFVSRLMLVEWNKKVKKAKDNERMFKAYRAERRFDNLKGKPSSYKLRSVNYDR